ncbi:hypothetical protein M9458_045191, partial [Cirrhinus mrigala]
KTDSTTSKTISTASETGSTISNTNSTASTGGSSWRARGRRRPRNDYETPNEEERTHRLPSKKRKTRNTVKDETNTNYCTAVAELAEAIKVAFPARVDTSKIGNCCQTREESVQDHHHQLYETFNKHSGLVELDDRGNQPGTWECHLRSWFLNGLRPEIAQAVKGNYTEWKNGRLAAILAHALHAEQQQTTKKERARAKTDKDLQLALVQAVSRPGGYSAPRNQQMRGGGGGGGGQGGRPSNWTERNPKQRGCVICGTDDHLTK